MSGPDVPGSGPTPVNAAGAAAADDGHTWWGRAWLEALEQRAQLDPNRLPRGRDYARSGAVGELVLSPGEARAEVTGRKRSPYLTRVRVRPFTGAEWDQVLDVICARLGRAAALLDGELPPGIADDLAAAGLSLLPGAGEVGPRCTCPDEADPCKHAAAVCYLVADALDTDPFVVLLLRGRSRGEVLAGLRARRRRGEDSGRAARGTAPLDRDGGQPTVGREAPTGQEVAVGGKAPAGSDQGVDARAVLGAPPGDQPVPRPPLPPPRPGHPAALPVDPPPWRAAMREDLLGLATDAARRAWELASGLSPDAGLALGADADLARRADQALGTPAFARLARRSGVDPRELARRGLAWRHGGAAGLEVLGTTWEPAADARGDAPELLKAARAALLDATGAAVSARGNQVTAAGIQLRLGRDLLWYPYALSDGQWEPAGPPQADPARAAETL
jgi:uncharacterized Zn finger protein